MQQNKSFYIYDDLFLQTVTCPLKYFHLTNDLGKRKSSKPVFRQRNKLHIRDAIAARFENCQHTSNLVSVAANETDKWLREEKTVICGAVVKHSNLLTRIPILVKNEDKFIIIQVHGKLRKQSDGFNIRSNIKSRSILRYLLKAAYRYEVLKNHFPKSKIETLFYFPNKHFKSSSDALHLYHKEPVLNRKIIDKQLIELFAEVQASDAVKKIHQQVPEEIAHALFSNQSVKQVIENIESFSENKLAVNSFDRHRNCKYCEFRLPQEYGSTGCWEEYFTNKKITHTGKHIFELIGHGNDAESKNGIYYQEEVELSTGFDSVEKLLSRRETKITMHQRRNFQILKSKDMEVPKLWLKKGIDVLDTLKYPLHFLDFEAATYALPMKKKSRPYSSVYFQFSCHTLFEDGEIVHSEWLDLQDGNIHPHREFVRNLGSIPGIYEGTIMQYSPFEKQGLNRLMADFKRWENEFSTELQILENIKEPENSGYSERFFDVSKMVRDFYYNEFLNDSLGLKQVLKSIMLWEQNRLDCNFFDNKIVHLFKNIEIDLVSDRVLDPYKSIQNSDLSILDGSDAMNAWISFKNDLITESEKTSVIKILQKYCALDSLALFVIFKHITQFTSKIDEEDYILLNRNYRES